MILAEENADISQTLHPHEWGVYIGCNWESSVSERGLLLCKNKTPKGTWLVQLIEHETLDPGLLSSNPTLGIVCYLKHKPHQFYVLWDGNHIGYLASHVSKSLGMERNMACYMQLWEKQSYFLNVIVPERKCKPFQLSPK